MVDGDFEDFVTTFAVVWIEISEFIEDELKRLRHHLRGGVD